MWGRLFCETLHWCVIGIRDHVLDISEQLDIVGTGFPAYKFLAVIALDVNFHWKSAV